MSLLRPQQTTDQEPRTEAAPARPLGPRLLRAIHLDLLGRPPLPEEADRWRGKALHEFLEGTLGGEAFWRHWYAEQLYYFLLIDSFRPMSPGAAEIVPDLTDGHIHVRDALHRIALTPSFDLRNPGADTFVTVVMEQLVGMTVQKNRRELEIGKALYDGSSGLFLGRKGTNQSDVVRIAIDSSEAVRELLARDHRRLLHAEPDRRQLKGWTRSVHKQPWGYVEVVRDWLLSDAYLERLGRRDAVPNRMFVKAVHVDLLGRLPDSEEARAMRSALDGLADSRPLRSVLARMLLDSKEARIPGKSEIDSPTGWVADLFQQLLGREARPEELERFVTVFHQEGCRPETIVYALLSSAEYHRY